MFNNRLHQARTGQGRQAQLKRAPALLLILAVFLLSLVTNVLYAAIPTYALASYSTKESCEAAGRIWNTPLGGQANCSENFNVDKQSPTWQAQSWWYFHAVKQCFSDAGALGTSNKQDIIDGKWFNGKNGSASGYVMRGVVSGIGDDGKADCKENDSEIFRKALEFWDVTPLELACDGGIWQRNRDQDCKLGDEDFKTIFGVTSLDAFSNYIKDHRFAGKEPPLPGAGQYMYNYRTLLNDCAGSSAGELKTRPGGSNVYAIKNPDNIDVFYIGTQAQDHDSEYRAYPNQTKKCRDIANDINANAAAFQLWKVSNPGQDATSTTAALDALCAKNPDDESCPKSKTTCGIDGLGWIICPALGFMSAISDQLFSFLASEFLSVDVRTVSATSGTHEAWSIMRNIANVAFVIAFLIIIFSQLTSVGINAYGIKKMLPRLIIAAILVNLSFTICQLAVDLSNILGYGIKALFGNVQSLATPNATLASGDATGNGFGIAVLILPIMAGGITLALAMSVPVILSVLLALLVIVFILLARKALIVLLIVIAPLAFVAYLLPNTEQWYKKWQKMFFALLLVFPIISVVFGASSLAAYIIKSTAADGDNLTPLIAIGVAAIPLVIVPSLLKGSIAAAGAIGATMKGWGDKSQGRIGGKVGSTSRLGQYSKYRKNEAEKRRALIQAGGFSGTNKNPLNWGRNATSRLNKAVNTSSLSGKFGNRSAAMGVSLAEKIEDEEVGEAQKLMRAGVDPHEMIGLASKHLEDAIDSGDVVKARAAQQILLNSGNKGLDTLHDTLSRKITTREQKESDVARNLRSELNQAGLKGKNNALAAWSYNSLDTTLDQTRNDAGTLEGLSDTELAGQSFEKVLSHHRTSGAIDQAKARSVIDNQNIWKDLSKEKQDLFVQLAGRGPAHPVAPPATSPTAPPTPPATPPTVPPAPPTPPSGPPTPPTP
jgi:hypothetical protein